MTGIIQLQHLVAEELESYVQRLPESNLYQPVRYFLRLGGKRLRPVLCLMACEAFGEDPKKHVHAALAVEVFHNFTLVHDDIMDEASMRRGSETVHKRWNTNAAILSGDAMLIEAIRLLETVPPDKLAAILKLFNKTAVEVCEGQDLDMLFENRDEVGIEEYLHMIALKTSVLLACSLRMGAILAGAPEDDQQHIYNFGLNAGIAFQLQDDLLDAFADSGKFGKETGGDIAANKKTYLQLTAQHKASASQRALLEDLKQHPVREEKIRSTIELFHKLDIQAETQKMINLYYKKASAELDLVDLPFGKKQVLNDFLEQLQKRDF